MLTVFRKYAGERCLKMLTGRDMHVQMPPDERKRVEEKNTHSAPQGVWTLTASSNIRVDEHSSPWSRRQNS